MTGDSEEDAWLSSVASKNTLRTCPLSSISRDPMLNCVNAVTPVWEDHAPKTEVLRGERLEDHQTSGAMWGATPTTCRIIMDDGGEEDDKHKAQYDRNDDGSFPLVFDAHCLTGNVKCGIPLADIRVNSAGLDLMRLLCIGLLRCCRCGLCA